VAKNLPITTLNSAYLWKNIIIFIGIQNKRQLLRLKFGEIAKNLVKCQKTL
jgi:hypothetical protein